MIYRIIKDRREQASNNDISNIWPILTLLSLIGIIAILLFSIRTFYHGNKNDTDFLSMCNIFGAGVLIAGASSTLGGILGFLFGVPKVVQNTSLLPTEEKSNQILILHNDNLVQISDWLTKIIVGVGLTQLNNIPSFVSRVGNVFTPIFGNDISAKSVVIAVMVYFIILGFFSVYIWTRLYFVRLLKNTDEALKERLKRELESSKKDNETTKIESKLKSEDIKALIKTYAQSIYKKSTNAIFEDIQKDKWGGLAENNGRQISASVREALNENDVEGEWFNITIEVASTDNLKPLTGKVLFHLHPTIPVHEVEVDAVNNKAILNVFAWRPFTVGVECDNKRTKLELDLSSLSDTPALFRSR